MPHHNSLSTVVRLPLFLFSILSISSQHTCVYIHIRTNRLVVQAVSPFIVVHANAAYSALTGIDSHAAVGKPIRKLVSVPESSTPGGQQEFVGSLSTQSSLTNSATIASSTKVAAGVSGGVGVEQTKHAPTTSLQQDQHRHHHNNNNGTASKVQNGTGAAGGVAMNTKTTTNTTESQMAMGSSHKARAKHIPDRPSIESLVVNNRGQHSHVVNVTAQAQHRLLGRNVTVIHKKPEATTSIPKKPPVVSNTANVAGMGSQTMTHGASTPTKPSDPTTPHGPHHPVPTTTTNNNNKSHWESPTEQASRGGSSSNHVPTTTDAAHCSLHCHMYVSPVVSLAVSMDYNLVTDPEHKHKRRKHHYHYHHPTNAAAAAAAGVAPTPNPTTSTLQQPLQLPHRKTDTIVTHYVLQLVHIPPGSQAKKSLESWSSGSPTPPNNNNNKDGKGGEEEDGSHGSNSNNNNNNSDNGGNANDGNENGNNHTAISAVG